MKIAILGSGGREHALALQISKSKKLRKLYCIPGNAGTNLIATNIDLTLNNFHFDPNNQSTTPEPFDPSNFIPDTLDWETDYQGSNIVDYELLEYIDEENNCNDLYQFYSQWTRADLQKIYWTF